MTLAICLALKPVVLLLDEVTSALDHQSALRVERLVKAAGAALLWVTHEEAQIYRVGGRVLHLPLGTLVRARAPSPIAQRPCCCCALGTLRSSWPLRATCLAVTCLRIGRRTSEPVQSCVQCDNVAGPLPLQIALEVHVTHLSQPLPSFALGDASHTWYHCSEVVMRTEVFKCWSMTKSHNA